MTPRGVYWFARAAVTNNHKLADLDIRNLLSPSSGGQKSEIKVSAGLVPSESCEEGSAPCLSPASRLADNLWLIEASLQTLSSCGLCVCLSLGLSSSYKDTSYDLILT